MPQTTDNIFLSSSRHRSKLKVHLLELSISYVRMFFIPDDKAHLKFYSPPLQQLKWQRSLPGFTWHT
ncbi:hypothetical protein FKM82_025594 [Ascaphus truei]